MVVWGLGFRVLACRAQACLYGAMCAAALSGARAPTQQKSSASVSPRQGHKGADCCSIAWHPCLPGIMLPFCSARVTTPLKAKPHCSDPVALKAACTLNPKPSCLRHHSATSKESGTIIPNPDSQTLSEPQPSRVLKNKGLVRNAQTLHPT